MGTAAVDDGGAPARLGVGPPDSRPMARASRASRARLRQGPQRYRRGCRRGGRRGGRGRRGRSGSRRRPRPPRAPSPAHRWHGRCRRSCGWRRRGSGAGQPRRAPRRGCPRCRPGGRAGAVPVEMAAEGVVPGRPGDRMAPGECHREGGGRRPEVDGADVAPRCGDEHGTERGRIRVVDEGRRVRVRVRGIGRTPAARNRRRGGQGQGLARVGKRGRHSGARPTDDGSHDPAGLRPVDPPWRGGRRGAARTGRNTGRPEPVATGGAPPVFWRVWTTEAGRDGGAEAAGG